VNKITIIGTTHKEISTEIGNINLNILYSIIENINPNIIFEEITLENYEKTYVNNEDPIIYERTAIKKYVENHNIKNIPIDTVTQPDNFLNSYDKIEFALKIKNFYNKESVELSIFIENCINRNDLFKINNRCFEDKITRSKQLLEEYIYNHNEPLINDYNIYNNHMCENREDVMARNIIEYKNNIIRNDHFNALVLVGVAHKIPIKNKITSLSNIECELYYENASND
jgi:hypothetical protein